MPVEPPVPTDPAREASLGRIALWLDPDDLRSSPARPLAVNVQLNGLAVWL